MFLRQQCNRLFINKCIFSEDSQNMQECHMTQNLHSESDPVQTYRITAAHELHCSHYININHKVKFIDSQIQMYSLVSQV